MGFNDEKLHELYEAISIKDINKQVEILKSHRCYELNNMHAIQDHVDCIDYMIYQLKK